MPPDVMPFFLCFGFVFFLVPTIICIVLAVRLNELRGRVVQLETRLADLARDLFHHPRLTPQVPPAPPAPHAPPAPAPAPIPLEPRHADSAPQPIHPPQPPQAVPTHPSQPAPAHGSEISGKLLDKLDQVRQKEHPPVPSAPAATPSATPVPAPVVIPIVPQTQPPRPAPAPALAHGAAQAPAPVMTPAPHPAPHAAPAPGGAAALVGPPPMATVPQPIQPPPAAPAAAAPGHPMAAPAPPRVPPVRPVPPPPAPQPPAKPRGLDFYLIAGFIVIGAIAIGLAAIFLVKIGIDKGLFGPLQRDWAAAIGALVLIGVGQWRRRFEGFWSQGLTAAGIVALFAAIFAATSVHHELSNADGFILLAITTAGAVAMSLQDWSGKKSDGQSRGGMVIATLGLIGGFLTPILVHSDSPKVPELFGYLIILHVGLIASTRIRGWSILAAASVVFSSLWLILWVFFKWDPQHGPIFGLFMLATVASLVISTVSQPNRWRGGKAGLAASVLTWLAVGLGLLASCLLLGKSQYDNLQWAFFAILVAGAFVLARIRPVYEGMAWLGSVAVLGMLAGWGWTCQLHGIEVAPALLADHLRFQGWLMGFGVATVLGAYACQWKSAAPVRWAVLANILALAYVGVAYWLLPSAPRPDEWAFLPLAAAGILAGLMISLIMQRQKIVTGEQCLAIYGHAILALLLMAPPMGLHNGAMTAAWAAILPLAALAIWRLKLPALIMGLLVAVFMVSVRALMVGSVVDAGGDGRNLFWNPVVWAYGTTLVTMALTAWLLEQCAELPARLHGVIPSPKSIAAMLQVGAAVSAFLLLTLEVRWGFHQGKLDANSALLIERGTFAIGWLLLAAAVTWIGKQVQRTILIRCGEVIGILGVVYAVIGLVFITNPLWWQWEGVADSIGTQPVFNILLFAYGVPAVLCGLLAFVLQRSDPENGALAKVAGSAGLILLFALVTLQIRQGYAGDHLAPGQGGISFTEFSTYSVAWLALGALVLAIGRRFQRDLLRRAGILLCTGGMAYAIVVVGLAMSPLFHHTSVGDWPVFNLLLYAYGTPILLAATAAWIIDPRSARLFGPLPANGDRPFEGGWSLGGILRAWGLVLLFILVTTEVRQGFQGAFLDLNQITFIERGTYPIAWLVLAAALLPMGYALRSTAARRGGLAYAAIGMGYLLLIGAAIFNPLWSGETINGGVIFNDLLFAFGLPAALCGLIAWLLYRHDPAAAPFAKGAGIVGLILLFVTVSLEVRQGYAGARLGLATAVSFTEFATYGVAWMALGAALLGVGKRWRMDVVHMAGLILCACGLTYAIAVVGILMSPLFHDTWVGDWPVFNHLLYAYGTAALLAALAAWITDPRAARLFAPPAATNANHQIIPGWEIGGLMRAGAVILLFILVTTEVRQAFQGAALNKLQMNFFERGTYGVAWFALAGALLPLGYILQSHAARRGGMIIAAIALAFVLLVCTLAMNPMLTHESVGATRIFNALLYTYGVPAAALATLAGALWNRGLTERACAWVAGIASLLLTWILVTLEVQQFFRGEHLGLGPWPTSEFTAYSLAWAALGIAFLVAGILRRSAILRWASLVMMLVTIPKVFLFDMAGTADWQRVLSFAGLGVSLMALAFVYQRFVFRKPALSNREDPKVMQTHEER